MPKKTGYTFGGYYTTTNGGGTQYYNANGASANNWAIADNTTLYAKWTATNYTVTYNTNGGNSIAQKTYTIETATFGLPTPVKAGHTFAGWYDNPSLTGNKVTQVVKGSTGNKAFYAAWTINQYTINFSAGEGGSVTATVGGNPIESGAQLDYGTQVTLTAKPSGVNAFSKWVDQSGTQQSQSNPYTITITGNTTRKAEFILGTTVYFKLDALWKSDNARFALYYWNSSSYGWTDLTLLPEDLEKVYYTVDIPAGYSDFKFVRMNPANQTNDWANKWNETSDLTIVSGKSLYDLTKRFIYLKPNDNWTQANARFAAYFYEGDNNVWVNMGDLDGDGYYSCEIPKGYTNVVLVRMNPSTTENNWDNDWHKSKDITITSNNNLYTINAGEWGDDGTPAEIIGSNHWDNSHWRATSPYYTITLDPFKHGSYGIRFDGKTYMSKANEEVVIENVTLGTEIQVIDAVSNTPKYGHKLTQGERMYDCSVVVEPHSGSVKHSVDAENDFTHTVKGNTSFSSNMVTTQAQRVYLHIPTAHDAGWNQSGGNYNCVWVTEFLTNGNQGRSGALVELTKDASISGKGDGDYYYCDIPAGYNKFYFERKPSLDSSSPVSATGTFYHGIPLNNINCFTLTSTSPCTGSWGPVPTSVGDYRIWYVEQDVRKSNSSGNEWKTVVENTYNHPSDVVKPHTTEGTYKNIVSLHVYKDKTIDGKTCNPEVILQKCTEATYNTADPNNPRWEYTWRDIEAHMVNGPLEAEPGMAMLPGRKNASPGSDVDDFVYDDGIEVIKGDTKPGRVWNFTIQQTVEIIDDKPQIAATLLLDEENLVPYEGNYYIRTSNADGKWSNYTIPANHMTHSEYAEEHSGYSHYFCKWVDINKGSANVKFIVANDYGTAISQELTKDDYTDNEGCIPTDANVRWSWNQYTNEAKRAYIQGTWKTGTQIRNNNLVVNYNSSSSAQATTELLDDSGDWIYQKNFDVKVGSHLNSLTAQYPVTTGSTQTFAENLDMLTGGDSDETYKVRVLYDFKINKTLVALVPNDKNATISIDVLIERINQGDATQVKAPIAYTNNQRSGEGSTVYGVMSFDKSHLTDPSKSSQEKLTYWMSFPFDVKLSEIFGFGEVGDYWMIKYYDGADRAVKGLYDDNTFWKFITNRNYTLKANQGYVLSLNKKVMDANSPIFTNTDKISLYFPSLNKITEIDPEEYTQTTCTIPEHTCTITSPTDRRTKDSNWNFIGVPSFANKNKTTTNENVKYFYDYDYHTDTYSVAPNGGAKTFKSMFAYMVQFAGIIDWSTFSFTSNGGQGLAAKKTANVEKHLLRIELQQNGTKADQTFVELHDDATTMFDMNVDLTKMFNTGANIYTLIGSETEVAANVMPIAETIIPVGVQVAKAGEYTFAMPEGTDGIVVELIDYETNTRTNMLLDEYTVNLGKGTFESRFALHVRPDKTVTSVEDINTNSDGVRKFIIDGVLYMQKDGALYDAQGRCVQ